MASANHPPVLVGVVLIGALVLGGLAGHPLGNRVYDYQWSDARFCNDCHAHDYASEAWERSAHAGLTTCHDCHRVPIRHYPRNLWVMLTRPPERPEDIPHPEVPTVVCEQCHVGLCDQEALTGPMGAALCDQVVKVERTPSHLAHLEAERRLPGRVATEAGRIECGDCHSGRIDDPHRFETRRAACVACHEEHRGSTVGGLPCRQCHGAGFLAAGAPEGAPGRP